MADENGVRAKFITNHFVLIVELSDPPRLIEAEFRRDEAGTFLRTLSEFGSCFLSVSICLFFGHKVLIVAKCLQNFEERFLLSFSQERSPWRCRRFVPEEAQEPGFSEQGNL